MPCPSPLQTAHCSLSDDATTSSSSSSSVPDVSLPKFRRDVDDVTRKSFFATPPSSPRPDTPNDRVAQQVRDTMARLGVSPVTGSDREEVEFSRTLASVQALSRANPASALIGSVGAAVMSSASWALLQRTIELAMLYPMDERIYIVQRITTVVRTGLVTIFALGAGICGVTSVGLLLLAVRVSYGMVTGEFNKKTKDL